MFQIGGESSEPKPAEVLVDIPDECSDKLGQEVVLELTWISVKRKPMLNDVIKLVDPRFQSVVAHVLHIVPKEILMTIIDSAPHSKIRIIECLDSKDNNITRVRYASIIKKWPTPECLKNVDWREIMGPFIIDQKDHDVCWAIVVSELIRAVRIIEKRNQDPKIRYSPQDLIDHAEPDKRRKLNDNGHYCYTSNLTKGFEYVLARTSHGATFGYGGCIKISLEVMLVYIPIPDEKINEFIQKYLGKPKFLLTRFSYPTLFTDAEEEIKKKDHLSTQIEEFEEDQLMQK